MNTYEANRNGQFIFWGVGPAHWRVPWQLEYCEQLLIEHDRLLGPEVQQWYTLLGLYEMYSKFRYNVIVGRS